MLLLTVDPQNGALPANDDSLAPLRNLLLLEGGTLAQTRNWPANFERFTFIQILQQRGGSFASQPSLFVSRHLSFFSIISIIFLFWSFDFPSRKYTFNKPLKQEKLLFFCSFFFLRIFFFLYYFISLKRIFSTVVRK